MRFQVDLLALHLRHRVQSWYFSFPAVTSKGLRLHCAGL